MKFIKKTSAFVLAAALLVSFSACGKKTESGNSEVIATVGDIKITAQDMRYYLINENYQLYSVYLNDHPEITDAAMLDAQFSWDEVYDENTGETYGEHAKKAALDLAISDAVKMQKAKELGIGLDEDETQDVRDYADSTEEQYGDDFPHALEASGLTSKEEFVNALIKMQTIDKLDTDFEQAPSNYITDEASFAEFSNDDQISAKHILISLTPTDENGEETERSAEDALAIAQTVKAKLDAGEDFDALMEEYNEDPGEGTAGYTFGRGEMVPEFEAAAFALKPGEISGIIETSYGYHIIKRVIGYSELLAKWKSEMTVDIDQDAYDKVPIQLDSEKPYNLDEDASEAEQTDDAASDTNATAPAE